MDKARQIIREELQNIIGGNSHFSDNNYGMPKSFNILNFAQVMEKEAGESKDALVQLMKLMNDQGLDSESKVAQAKEIIFSWYNQGI